MQIKALTTYYQVYPDEIVRDEATKIKQDEWWTNVKMKSTSIVDPVTVKTTHELVDDVDELSTMRKFFEGVVVLYYAVQDRESEVGSATLKLYREMLWHEILGYELELPNGVILSKRKSSTTLTKLDKWYSKLRELEEGVFAQAGYRFPSRSDYKDMIEAYKEKNYPNYKAVELAKSTLVKQLIKEVQSKYETDKEKPKPV